MYRSSDQYNYSVYLSFSTERLVAKCYSILKSDKCKSQCRIVHICACTQLRLWGLL